jgi:hypothetical protein
VKSPTEEAKRLRGHFAKAFGVQPPADDKLPVTDNIFLNKAKEITPIIDRIYLNTSAEIHLFDKKGGVAIDETYPKDQRKFIRAICDALPCKVDPEKENEENEDV